MTASKAATGTSPEPPFSAGPQLSDLGNWSKFILLLLATGSGALAAMSFDGMFDAVRRAMLPYFYGKAWMIPVGTDLGIVVCAAFSVFFEAKGMRLWWLRPLTLVFVGLQLGLNVGAAHGDPLGSAGHAVLPLLFISIIEIWTFFIRTRRNLIHKSERERIPRARYFADFKGSRDLRKRMVLWGINVYSEALRMRQQVLRAEVGLKEIYGPEWRKTAPQDWVMMLNTSEYLDEACTEIAKKLADTRKRAEAESRRTSEAPAVQRTANPAASNGGSAGENSGRQPTGIRTCCMLHKLLDSNSQLPPMRQEELLAEGKKLWAKHVEMHSRPPGADNLQKVLTISIVGARELRNQLAAWWAESGGQSGSGSGPASGGTVGQAVGAGHPNGSVVTAGGN